MMGLTDWRELKKEAKKQADQTVIYTVKSGDTLAGIADDYKMNMNIIADANGLTSPYALEVGQQLKIPGAKKRFSKYRNKEAFIRYNKSNPKPNRF